MEEEEPSWEEKHLIIELIIKLNDYSDFYNTMFLITDIIVSLEDSLLYETLIYIRRAISELDDQSCLDPSFCESLQVRSMDTDNQSVQFLINNLLMMVEDYSDDE